jgi:hypothetical protein
MVDDTQYISPAKEEWYINLIEDLRDIVVERSFSANWEKILGKHEIGKRILEEYPNFERKYIYGKDIAGVVAESLNCSRRDINRCIRFARKYPNLNLLPAGKNVSWNKIIREYLPIKKGEENDEDKNKSNSGGLIKQIDKQGNKATGYSIEFSTPFSSPEYLNYVRQHCCCVCEKSPPSDYAHFPRGKKFGKLGIPLCRMCHTEYHNDPLNFMDFYKTKWGKYFEDLIIKEENV